MKMIVLFLVIVSFFFGASHLYEKKNRFGLQAKFASPTFSPSPEWELPPLRPPEQATVDQILRQKFTYLARGSQAFAFISEDGQYILKLFKQHKWHPKHFLGYLPLSFNPYYRDYLKRKEKQNAVLSSCKTAILHVQSHTGVIFSHLNPTPLAISSINLTDKHGKSWTLDLSKSCFLLQKKADLFYPHIQACMAKNDLEGAKYAITSTFNLIDKFMRMGVYGNNAILRKNFGFIDNEAMQFDIGKFKFDPSYIPDRQEIHNITQGFQRWLKLNHPELLPHFHEQLELFLGII